MFRNKVFKYSTLAMILAIAVYFVLENRSQRVSNGGKPIVVTIDSAVYQNEIQTIRNDKDIFYKTSDKSPIKDKEAFSGAEYYFPDMAYRVVARITKYDGPEKELKIAYTNRSEEIYHRYGYAHFVLAGRPQKLLLLETDGQLALLFKDSTNGNGTYGGGRYLDFKENDIVNDSLLVDFNLAYNPYCAFDENYACPVPPAENKMAIRVSAGEKFVPKI